MKLSKEDMVSLVPATPKMLKSLFAGIYDAKNLQAVAATLVAQYLYTAESSGRVDEVLIKMQAVPAAGESMTVDVLKNGVSILNAVVTCSTGTAGTPANLYQGSVNNDLAGFVAGDIFTTTRTYTAGGTPTPMSNVEVVLRPAPYADF